VVTTEEDLSLGGGGGAGGQAAVQGSEPAGARRGRYRGRRKGARRAGSVSLPRGTLRKSANVGPRGTGGWSRRG